MITPFVGYRYLVYFDSHRKIFSLKNPKTGKVESKSKYLLLLNCELKVSLLGRQRVLDTGRKNVHAYVSGEVAEYGEIQGLFGSLLNEYPISFSYNPRVSFSFQGRYGEADTPFPIFKLKEAIMWIDKEGKPHCRGKT